MPPGGVDLPQRYLRPFSAFAEGRTQLRAHRPSTNRYAGMNWLPKVKRRVFLGSEALPTRLILNGVLRFARRRHFRLKPCFTGPGPRERESRDV